MRLSYRLQQLLRNVRSKSNPDTLAEAANVLTPGQLLLFRSMSPADQAHSLRVMQTLKGQGETDSQLLAAALLHDVGKSRFPLRVWERALIVVCQSITPGLAARLGRGEAKGWRRPFVIAARHPHWGAEMVNEVGGSTKLTDLIRAHQDEPDAVDNSGLSKELRALQAADNTN